MSDPATGFNLGKRLFDSWRALGIGGALGAGLGYGLKAFFDARSKDWVADRTQDRERRQQLWSEKRSSIKSARENVKELYDCVTTNSPRDLSRLFRDNGRLDLLDGVVYLAKIGQIELDGNLLEALYKDIVETLPASEPNRKEQVDVAFEIAMLVPEWPEKVAQANKVHAKLRELLEGELARLTDELDIQK